MAMGDGNEDSHEQQQCDAVRAARAPPLYTTRQPPLVQPLETSSFTEKTFATFGVRDLGHEWVTLFQTIGAVSGGCSRSMKLQIPDTVLLSPSGLPSMWYSTSASSHIKPRNLMRVTPRSILDAFTSSNSGTTDTNASSPGDIVAVRRVGFRIEVLTLRQLEEFCREMEQPRIIEPRQEWENASDSDADDDDGDGDDDSHENRAVCRRRSALDPTPFCLQRFIYRHRDMTFLVLWRCKHRANGLPVRDNVTDKLYARSFYKRPLPLLTSDIVSKCELFLFQRAGLSSKGGDISDTTTGLQRSGTSDDEVDSDADGFGANESKARDVLTHLNLDSATLFEDALLAHGFDEDVIIPQLYYMKLAASEILNRLNRGLQARRASGILCEFFVGARDKHVYFSGLCGTHWEHAQPSWETLARVDPISSAISAFLDKRRRAEHSPMQQHASSNVSLRSAAGVRASFQVEQPKSLSSATTPSQLDPFTEDDNVALRMFSGLNPRFPSVQSPYVSEKQWRNQSPLLPPDVSPRYIGTQVPKSYRNGRFHVLLTPKQADSVNRLNLSPRPPVASVHHSLAKQFAKFEKAGGIISAGRPFVSPRLRDAASRTAAVAATSSSLPSTHSSLNK